MAAPAARAQELDGVGARSWGAGTRRAVVAFPPAGSDSRSFGLLGAAFAELVPGAAFHAIDPPGRGSAARAQPRDVRGYAALAARAVARLVPDGADSCLFGHSFGGYVALETARALLRSGVPAERLSAVVFATAPRHQIAGLADGLADDERWADRLRSLGGVPERVLTSPFFRSTYLPLIRGDVRDGRAYLESGPSFDELSDVAVLVAAAERDSVVGVEDMASWLDVLPGAAFAALPCGHFPDEEDLPALVATLAGAVRSRLAARRSDGQARSVSRPDASM